MEGEKKRELADLREAGLARDPNWKPWRDPVFTERLYRDDYAPGSAGQNGAHTPGPWVVDEFAIPERGGSALYIRSDERHWAICAAHETNGCISGWRDISKAEALANARLIAAAPDLLASERANVTVLENLLAYLRKHEASLPPFSTASLEVRVEKTRAAIAKATGEGV